MAAEAIAAKTQVTSAAAQADASAKAEQTAARPPVKRRPAKDDDSTLEEVVKCSAFKNAMNTAPREIVKGLFRRR